MKNYLYIIAVFVLYALAFTPYFFRAYCPEKILQHEKVVVLIQYVLALITICAFLSMLALVLRWYKLSIIIAIIPLFVEAVFACSVFLLLTFRKEISDVIVQSKISSAGSVVGQKICAVGRKIWSIISTPFHRVHK